MTLREMVQQMPAYGMAPPHVAFGGNDDGLIHRAAVLSLIPEGAVLVTEEGLARAICVVRPPEVDQAWIADWPPDNECQHLAAAILARLRDDDRPAT
jgi:hypothetical protein